MEVMQRMHVHVSVCENAHVHVTVCGKAHILVSVCGNGSDGLALRSSKLHAAHMSPGVYYVAIAAADLTQVCFGLFMLLRCM